LRIGARAGVEHYDTPVKIGVGVFGIDPDRLVVVGDGEVVVALASVRVPPIIVGDGAIALTFLPRFNQPCTVTNTLVERAELSTVAKLPFGRPLRMCGFPKNRRTRNDPEDNASCHPTMTNRCERLAGKLRRNEIKSTLSRPSLVGSGSLG
jgi:hypothetical protein